MFHEHMLQTNRQLNERISSLQKKIDTYPDGYLVCCHNGERRKWYHSQGPSRQLIPKSNRSFAELLAHKKYDSLVLEELLQEKKAQDSYLRLHPTNKKSEQLLTRPGYAELLSSSFQPLSQELSDWMNTAYEQNQKHPEHLLHKTLAGHCVRSKSEAMIDSLLYTNKIPFRYECALVLDSITLFPDFTIRHPQTGKIYYWEHFGLMDDPSYCKHTLSKLQLYITHGLIPSIQLITTYETQQNPLTTETIQQIIEHYFLS